MDRGQWMSYSKKMSLLIVCDVLTVLLSIGACYFFRFDSFIPEEYRLQCLVFCVVSVMVSVSTMFAFKLYRQIWRYASIDVMVSIIKAVTLSCAISYTLTFVITGKVVVLSILIISFETMLLFMGGLRFFLRVQGDYDFKHVPSQKRAIIVGAGSCGLLVAKKLKGNKNTLMYPVAFIDDDTSKQRQTICGLPVLGGRDMIADAVKKYQIDEIVIAMPSVAKKEITAIIDICKKMKVNLKIIPRIDDLIHGRLTISEIRNVEVEDLLGRDPVMVNLLEVAGYLKEKTVLVTGAGGSIGSELCRQIVQFQPAQLLLLGHGENSIYAIDMELKRKYPHLKVITIIADIQDESRMNKVFECFKPQVVFHAAAHKHVPLMELNPEEAIKNNVLGTKNVAGCADRHKAERFVLISTDKAVNPTSVMGATKRIAEIIVQSLNKMSLTKFSVVRFGNVLGSRGSVIPQFKQQISAGGPITVTHPDMIRYFMTIPEAAQLVIQAGAFAEGGEVFILDMGKSVKILDLAEDLIRLSGLEPYKDIDIVFTGIRPGEKLYEELLTGEEGLTATKHNRIFISMPAQISFSVLEMEMKLLDKAVIEGQIKEVIGRLVPSYQNVS
jgi:FlaA1/EpsC-like NDP-sugar epimerase